MSAAMNKKINMLMNSYYKAKLIGENYSSSQVLIKNEEFVKSWHFKNVGEESWPIGTKFCFRNGDLFGPLEK